MITLVWCLCACTAHSEHIGDACVGGSVCLGVLGVNGVKVISGWRECSKTELTRVVKFSKFSLGT